MKRVRIPLVALILMAGLMTLALLIGGLSAPTASAADDGCTFHCFDGRIYRDDFACGYEPKDCSFCDLVCPGILQPST